MTQTHGGPPPEAGPPSSRATLAQDPPDQGNSTAAAHLPALADGGKQQLEALWAQIAEYGRTIQDKPLSDIQATLNGYKQQITAIIKGSSGTTSTAPTSSASADPAPSSTPSGGQAQPTDPAQETAPAGVHNPGTTQEATAPAGQYVEGGQPTSSVVYPTPEPTVDSGGGEPPAPIPTSSAG